MAIRRFLSSMTLLPRVRKRLRSCHKGQDRHKLAVQVAGDGSCFAWHGIHLPIRACYTVKGLIGKRDNFRDGGGAGRIAQEFDGVLIYRCHPALDVICGDLYVMSMEFDVGG